MTRPLKKSESRFPVCILIYFLRICLLHDMAPCAHAHAHAHASHIVSMVTISIGHHDNLPFATAFTNLSLSPLRSQMTLT